MYLFSAPAATGSYTYPLFFVKERYGAEGRGALLEIALLFIHVVCPGRGDVPYIHAAYTDAS